jgi:hypothetical protein
MFSSIQFNRIKGLTLSYPELGKVKIGQLGQERTSQSGTKYRLPEKLDHFRVTLRVRDKEGQFALDEEVHKALGPEPKELNVTLVYDDPTLNCPSRLNAYDGSRRWCHGNGERALRLDGQGIYRECECPCPLLSSPEEAAENKGKAKNQIVRCKPYGTLRVQLPIKQESIGVYGFRTTSAETISNLLAVQASVLMHTGGVLGGIPLRLRIYPATDNTPGGPSRSWKVTLDLPPGGWDEVDEAAKRLVQARLATRYDMKAIEASHRKALAAVVEHPEDADSIIDELFPKPITIIDGVEVLDEEPEADGGPVLNTTAVVEPPKGASAQPAVASEPEKAPDRADSVAQGPGVRDAPPPPPPDSVLVWTENYAIEVKAGSPEVKAEAIKAQVEALEVLAKRKGYEFSRLTKPLTEFSRQQRHGFFEHLKAMPDVEQQAALPWG